MATQVSSQIPAGTIHKLMLRSLYTVNGSNFVIGDYMPKAITQMQSASEKLPLKV